MTFKVTLVFETKDDAENWVAGYTDGGGEQTLGYVVQDDGSSKTAMSINLILRGYRQCPGCRFGDIGTMQEYRERYKELMELDPSNYPVANPKKSHKCQNCGVECDEKDIINA